ncbi:MAG: hypothetical protein P0Y49_09335 [Candidatus Pedobacter colombiensis]|uniref:Uncharacterized protein n=1 Tax=Candidatus Pedobacter colombiensis TaxID=3121371 RepID=A0AAJ5WC69_9SPHI|nr:hypothetical protein [Pedobacter sp.]WEK21343.1 MAG: hypothetical protein P0Y49_09335 [Pedobacter sp.]
MKIKIFALLLPAFLFTSAWAQEKKTETQFDEDWAKVIEGLPLFINGNIAKTDVGAKVAYSCLITPFSPALQPGYVFHTATENIQSKRSMGIIFNLPVKLFIQILYGHFYETDTVTKSAYFPAPIPNARTVFKDIDSAALVVSVDGKKQWQNLYNIQFTSSKNIPTSVIRRHMISDIELQFGVKTYWEKQVKKCIVISRNGLPIPEYQKGDVEYKLGTDKNGQGGVSMNNVPLVQLINFMLVREFRNTDYPIVDETDFTKNLGKVSFSTKDPGLTFEKMRVNMAKFGFKFSIEEREVNMLVITKANM